MLCTAKEVAVMMPAASALDQIILKLKSSGFSSTVIRMCCDWRPHLEGKMYIMAINGQCKWATRIWSMTQRG